MGGVLLVEGEPGIGRSSLLREAAGEAAGRGFLLAAGAAGQLGRTVPFAALYGSLHQPFAADDPGRELSAAARWITSSGPASNGVPVMLRSWSAWTICTGGPGQAGHARRGASGAAIQPGRVAPGPVEYAPARRDRLFGRLPGGAGLLTLARWMRARWRRCSRTRSAHHQTRA